MDFVFLSHEALISLEKHLHKRNIKKIIDVPFADYYDVKQFNVEIKLEDIKGSNNKIIREIIEPACFYIANEINELNEDFDTFYRIIPDDPRITHWSRSEIKNKSITVMKVYNNEKECEMLSINVGILKKEMNT